MTTQPHSFLDSFPRCVLTVAAAMACLSSAPLPAATPKQETKISAAPGSLLRWSAPGTKSCREGKRSWRPLGETCYFPIDILQKPGIITVTRVGVGRPESARITIEPFDYGTEEVNLGDIPQRDPSTADLKRNAREGILLGKVWRRKEGPAQFTLPLGPPAKPMPPGKAFGVNRVFNGKPAPQPHMGTDYAAGPGTPVLAVADGIVAMAQDLFFPGNAVLIDHGDGLVSMSFHLSNIDVQAGQSVKKGETIGKVGTTGRSTGPHLFFGVRWHDARINPKFLLEDPAKIPAVNK
jgi:Peptidase family M23